MAVPQELINEILLWLPVKSLLRFRCVCKPVCAVIGDKSFIKSHFKRSSENKIHRKLIDLGLYLTDTDRIRIHALEFDDDFRQELVLEKSVPSKLYELFYSYCNGLVLLCVLPCKLSVWNPSTRKYRILPAFTRNRSFALGYDSTTDEYKAVVIISKKNWDRSQVWIFELRSNCWRRIQDFPYVDHDCIEDGGNGDCFLDGAMHFICHGRDEHASYIIVAFDVAKETFSVVYAPTFYTTETVPTRLHVFGESLTMSLSCFIVEEQTEILLMKKDGDAVTWTKLYKAKQFRFSDEAFECIASGRVAYSKEGDNVFISSNGMLCSYDLREKSVREIVPKNTHNLDMFAFIESLVSVGP